MTMCTVPLVAPRSPMRERRTDRRVSSGKRLAMVRAFPGKIRAVTRRSLDPCDNSNDSGLGFDNHVDHHASITERLAWTSDRAEAKRPRLDIKLEDDEVNDNFSFPETIQRTCKDTMSIIRTAPSGTTPTLSIHGSQSGSGSRAVPRCTPLSSRSAASQPITLTSQLSNISRDGDLGLRIVHQPEQQHRARYQTEGSRGAVKDRSGNGFPVVQLTGYSKPATLQVFIGTDVGKVSPHMFYQACRVSGKNSTPCVEKKLDGTVVIELQLDPTKDMTGVCDCVGILKERNVDVEHRFPDQIGSRSKKKSTRCRMVFRTTITHENGINETLQVCSQPIVCTQPPGIPEICKKSLTSCPATGGLELFILGKNFLKDTKVFFQQADEQGIRWEQFVVPDKEFLQQTHLVCVIPPYARSDITEPVTVRLLVVSSGKTSEPHQFVYTPTSGAVSSVRVEPQASTFMNKAIWSSVNKHEQGIMPPPGTNHMPITQRRPSVNVTSPEVHSPPLHSLKQELIDENSQNSIDPLELHRERFRNISESSLDCQQGDSNMTMINESSMDLLRRSSASLENSMNSMNENSMDMIRRNSGGGNHENSMDVPLVNTTLTLHDTNACMATPTVCTSMPNHVELPVSIIRDELAVMDLRMKMPAATVADLANTNAPSLATLQSFCVTEPTNMPLPAQTAQSIENYLSTIETKPVNALTLPGSGALHLTQMLTTTQQSSMLAAQKVLTTQVIPPQLSTQSLSHCILGVGTSVSNFAQAQPSLLSATPVRSGELPQNTLIGETPLNAIQSAIEGAIESSSNRNVHSPQDILIGNKSPLMPAAPAQDILMAPPTHLNVEINPTSVNISPEVILNAQISPSMMCNTTSAALTQDGLESNLIQPQIALPETPLLAADPTPTPVLSNQLSSIIHTEPEKAILFNATVDLLETQKKISQLETLASGATAMEQVIINDILSTSPSHEPTPNPSLTSVVPPPTQNGVKIVPQSEKKNEDRMIPSGFATMSDNELISIINPSCFDQVSETRVTAIESSGGPNRKLHLPQDIQMGNNSPLMPATPVQDILMAPSAHLNVEINPTSVNISPDVILNAQISPSMMCNTTSAALSQDGLESNLIQPQIALPETPLLAADPTPTPVLSNQLSSIIHTEPEKAILFNATVDLLETQKKISQLETLASGATAMEQVIINDILSTSPSHEPTPNPSLTSVVSPPTQNGVKIVPQSEKKNEDRMIPSGFATMSDNELISIINPSCFDQV